MLLFYNFYSRILKKIKLPPLLSLHLLMCTLGSVSQVHLAYIGYLKSLSPKEIKSKFILATHVVFHFVYSL